MEKQTNTTNRKERFDNGAAVGDGDGDRVTRLRNAKYANKSVWMVAMRQRAETKER